jgi:6-phospho-beta-glucosidase
MILAILGGSAYSTPVLVQSLLATAAGRTLTVRLAGLSSGRLRAVARACVILSNGTIQIEQFGEGEWKAALNGSDVVVIQVRVGYYDSRHFDETFSLEYDIPGDEGLGPGGLSAAWRAWPHIRAFCSDIQAFAPRAQTILLSSPGSLLVRLAGSEFPSLPLTAVCELPFTTLQHICAVAGVPRDEVSFEYAGVNHLGWLYGLEWRGEDLLAGYIAGNGSRGFPEASLISRLNAFPLKYLRLHYEQAAVVEEQKQRVRSRAEQLQALADEAFEIYGLGDRNRIEATLQKRKAEWYPHAVVPLIRFWMGENVDVPLFLSMGRGDMHERCFFARGGKLQPVPRRKSPSGEVEEILERFVAYERIAAEAILERTEDALSEALSLHPWVSGSLASALAARIVKHSSAISSSATQKEVEWLNSR